MSAAAEHGAPALPEGWSRLERAAEDAAVAVGFWKRRALEAEEELARLRLTLEELATSRGRDSERGDLSATNDEVQRLRAENAALRSRMLQGRKRVGTLLRHLAALRVDE